MVPWAMSSATRATRSVMLVVVGQGAVELHQHRFVCRDHAVQSGDVGRGEHVGQVLHDLPLGLRVTAGGADPDGRVAALGDNAVERGLLWWVLLSS